MVDKIYWDFHSSISDDINFTKIYGKRDDLDFDMINFPNMETDVPRVTSYGVHIAE